MGLKSFFTKTPKPVMDSAESVSLFKFSRPELPSIVEARNKDYVLFGEDNLYPEKLIEYLSTSALHNAIVISKAKMVAGSGVTIDGVDPDEQDLAIADPRQLALTNEFVDNPSGDGNTNLNDLIYSLALDYETFGAYAIEVIWSLDFTRIAEIKHVDVSKIRSGKEDEDGDIDCYFYNENWRKPKDAVRIAAFDKNNEEDYRQLLYVRHKRPGLEYYGEPGYVSALAWITIDSQLGQYFLSVVENGFSPSMTIKFFKKPGSLEERDDIVRGIKQQFSGTKNAGKAMIFFSDGKDLAPDVTPVDVTNLDKQFNVLEEQVMQQIISGHRVTSPMLVGIATSGKLGYSQELESSYKIFNSTVIQPDQKNIQRTLNKLLAFWGSDSKLSITEFNPLS